MAQNVPTNVWRIPTQNSEMGSESVSALTTQSGLIIITQSGNSITTQGGTQQNLPASIWETVETVPTSVWRTPSGNNESTSDGVFNIADPQGFLLIDVTGAFVVDTGVEMPIVPVSVWEEDDSI